MATKKLLLCFVLFSTLYYSHAQDSSLLKMLNDSMVANSQKSYVTGTFKAEHVVNMQTIEAPGAGAMSFIIQHRFGALNSGSYNFFGLDNATIRLGLNFGITDRLTAGISRTSYFKTYEGYIKYKLLRQTEGRGMPLTVSLLGSISYVTNRDPAPPLAGAKSTMYAAQLLLARKFSRLLSLQLVPTYLHYNLLPSASDKKDQIALCAGGRLKFTKRMSINAEYNYLLPDQAVSYTVQNSLSLGWDIETGGHVFQFVFSNSQSLIEPQYIGKTTGRWNKDD
ncbi:MAG TPA: DUF5777 family beta-barrel protein, partial [Chitinophagaceae bacterium]|nr:DUF5777 family beta-barrel protein [Chitinophagaceae bacterium]